MDDVTDFLSHHRIRLLRYLEGIAPQSADEPSPLDYIDLVLDEWSRIPERSRRQPVSDTERTFWYALYALEDLVEYPDRREIDPYEAILLKNLAEVRELLKDGLALPPKYFATRPGEIPLEPELTEKDIGDARMPEISRFLGIIIAMYYSDHPPPHFHAKYGGHEIKVSIETGEVIEGNFPHRAQRLVLEWRELHKDELLENWSLAENHEPLNSIEPLE